MKLVMSLHCSHVLSGACDHAQTKMHTVAEQLLLSGTLRPIKTESSATLENCLSSAKDMISTTISQIIELVNAVVQGMSQMNFKSTWQIICDKLFRLSDSVTTLVELCVLVVYQNLTSRDCSPSAPSLINKYAACYAGLEIRLSCTRLKRARYEEMSGELIMDLCSNISKYISVLTDICRKGSDSAADLATRDQFKLGIKTVTCAAGSLIASIKLFKGDNSQNHHSRIVIFCEPVLAASNALVSLATEDEFTEREADLSDKGREVMKSVFGPCMNVVSGCVQMCKVVREFAQDPTNAHYFNRAQACLSSIQKSTNHITVQLKKHFQIDFDTKAVSPLHQEEETGGGHLLEIFRRSSPQPQGSLQRNHGNDKVTQPDNGQSSPRSSTASELSFSSSLSR